MKTPKFEQGDFLDDTSDYFWAHYITSLDEKGKNRIFNKEVPGVRYESVARVLENNKIKAGTILIRKPVSIIKVRPEVAKSIDKLGKKPLRFKSAEKLTEKDNRWYVRLQTFPDSLFPAEWFVKIEMSNDINKKDLFTELNSEKS